MSATFRSSHPCFDPVDNTAKNASLTALEAAEEAYAKKLAKITTPEHPPIVLGRAQHQNSVHQQQQLRAQQQQQQQMMQDGHHPSRSRRSRSSTDTDLHSTHDPADDQSTVVNPNARNRGSRQQQYQEPPPAQAAMFWNRTRSRRSAGGDR